MLCNLHAKQTIIKLSTTNHNTFRSPTHQIQMYNQYGQFVRKFGANILQHPRGVCVDNKGRIIVVECKVIIASSSPTIPNICHNTS